VKDLWCPGKFEPKPASQLESNWLSFSPFGWEVLPAFGLLISGFLLEYAIFCGHVFWGSCGLVLWGVFIWIALVAAAATLYRRGETTQFTGHELGVDPQTLQRTASHMLWLQEYYFDEANGTPVSLIIETVQGKKRIELKRKK
jgi:hypothetical protein